MSDRKGYMLNGHYMRPVGLDAPERNDPPRFVSVPCPVGVHSLSGDSSPKMQESASGCPFGKELNSGSTSQLLYPMLTSSCAAP